MVDAIVGGVLKSAANWLLDKGRESAAKRLRDGDRGGGGAVLNKV